MIYSVLLVLLLQGNVMAEFDNNIDDTELVKQFEQLQSMKSDKLSEQEDDDEIDSYISDTVIGKHEGGYQDEDSDPGNFINKNRQGTKVGTNFGISADVYKDHIQRDPTVEDMRNIKKEEAAKIYKEKFYKGKNIHKLPKGLRKLVLDMSINHGRGIKIFQKAIGAKPDGVIGPETIKKSKNADIDKIIDARKVYIKKVIKNDPKMKKWKNILLNRAESYRQKREPAGEASMDVRDFMNKLLADTGASNPEDELPPVPMAQLPPIPMALNQPEEAAQAPMPVPEQSPENLADQTDALAKLSQMQQAPQPQAEEVPEINPETQMAQQEALSKLESMNQPAVEPEQSPLDLLKAAQGERDSLQKKAMLLRAFKKIGAAGVLKHDPDYKVDTSAQDDMMKMGKQKVTDVFDQRKLEGLAQKMKLGELNERKASFLLDPNNPMAKSIRKSIQQKINKQAAIEGVEPIQIPEVASIYEMEFFGDVAGSGKSKMSAFQKASIGLQERRADQSEARMKLLETKEGRLSTKDKWRVEEKDELSDKQTEQITSLDDGLALAARMEKLLPSVQDNLGVYASRIEEGKRYIPMTERDPDFVEMQQIAGTELADYVKTISGAAVSEEEAQRLKKNIPNMDDKPEEFKRKLETFFSVLREYKATKLSNIEKQGKDPSRFQEAGSGKKEAKAPESDKVRVRLPDGRVGSIPRSKLKQALEKGAEEL